MRIAIFIFVFFIGSINATQSFISNDEYAKMLYKNPRGIGCDLCHGERGEGKVISSYIKSGKKISLIGPKINDISMRRFYRALDRANRLMPDYFLTEEEKAYLYYYLTKQKNKVKVANVNKTE